MLLPTPPVLTNDCLKALSNPTRILIVRQLSASPMTVTELCEALPDFPQTTISQHLSLMRMLGLVSFTSSGNVHTYRVDKSAFVACADFIRDIVDGGAA
ncbi:metalloregulator ArsR/SmtB family transcription factor [Arthrobacter sp. UYCo732]|uniref:ArsR/SmtB family transcription factor n=1 Tax=Arthrobacter sp. UYCo732 TaxID=3156336 RepID=UPI003399F29F